MNTKKKTTEIAKLQSILVITKDGGYVEIDKADLVFKKAPAGFYYKSEDGDLFIPLTTSTRKKGVTNDHYYCKM